MPIQESIPVGCVPLACQPYMLLWLPDVCNSREGGPPVNKFEQVSIRCHWRPARGPMSDVGGGGGCTVRSVYHVNDVIWALPPPVDRLTARLTRYENITFPQLHWRAITKVNNILVLLLTKFMPRNEKHLPSEGDELITSIMSRLLVNCEYKTTYGKSYHQLSLPNRFYPYT